jgi:hypothetical protein
MSLPDGTAELLGTLEDVSPTVSVAVGIFSLSHFDIMANDTELRLLVRQVPDELTIHILRKNGYDCADAGL